MATPHQQKAYTSLKDTLLGPGWQQGNTSSDTLDASFSEAGAVMDSDGINVYLYIARVLVDNNRSSKLVMTFLQTMPQVVRHSDISVMANTYETMNSLTAWLGTERIIQMVEILPTVANRVGSADGVKRYLKLVEELAALAPTSLKLLFTHTGSLLARLPINGLRQWALWGARTHAHQPTALAAYFSLSSADSQAILQRQRRGTLFADVQRQLNFFLRALWGADFFMRPVSVSLEDDTGDGNKAGQLLRPTINNGVIQLPDAMDDYPAEAAFPDKKSNGKLSGKMQYRAAAAHCAAHLRYSRPWRKTDYTPLQQICIGLVEDARVEALAIRDFPGLQQLWQPFHEAKAHNVCITQSVLTFLERVAFCLLNPACSDCHPVIEKTCEKFAHLMTKNSANAQHRCVEAIGIWLAKEITGLSALPRASQLTSLDIPYRDDNAALWHDGELESEEWHLRSMPQVKRTVSVMEMVNEIDCELADDDAQEIWILESEFFRDGDPENVSMNQLEGKVQVSPPYYYPEWDYRAGFQRPSWVTLTEHSTPSGKATDIDAILARRQPLVRRLQAMVEALQPKGLTRLRRQYEGDGLDLDAAIEAMKELRRGSLPEMNIDQRLKRHKRDLAVLVLLDLSQSTLDRVPDDGENRTILDMAREAAVMLAGAIDGIGDPFAIHGFASNGRSDVQYYRYKDFDDEYDDKVKARLAAMKGGLSTRMGAALRHAKTYLTCQPQRKKLLLLVSDGEPADIDVRDPLYLQADTRNAADELQSLGIIPFCLTIDPEADNYVSQVFGKGHYTVLDRITKLPETLPALFASLTKQAG